MSRRAVNRILSILLTMVLCFGLFAVPELQVRTNAAETTPEVYDHSAYDPENDREDVGEEEEAEEAPTTAEATTEETTSPAETTVPADTTVPTDTVAIRTSTNDTRSANWNKLVSGQELNGKSFKEFAKGITGSAVIPGMEATHVLDKDNKDEACADMAPQGLCIADGYTVISAYCTDSGSPHSSVLYVLRDGQYVETLVLVKADGTPLTNHLGGLTYYNGYVYMAGSTDKCVYRVSLRDIRNSGSSDARKVTARVAFPTDVTASFIGQYRGKLYVGTFAYDWDTAQSTTIYGYNALTGRHDAKDEITLPTIKVQGIEFLEQKDGVYILVSASYNRNTVSKLISYKWDGESIIPSGKTYKTVQLPNMSEDLCLSGSSVWVLFESAAKKYLEGEILRPLDRAVSFSTASLKFDPQADGIVKGPDCKWGKYKNGTLDAAYTGIYPNENGWWRVKDGFVDFGANGIYKNAYGWWKCTNGKVTFKETGVFQNENGWWRVEKSKVNFDAKGIYRNQYGWWKTTGGRVTFDENGVFKNEYGWWKVENSKVNFNFTGIAKNEYGTWYLENGKVNFNKNGKVQYKGRTYKVTDGRAKPV